MLKLVRNQPCERVVKTHTHLASQVRQNIQRLPLSLITRGENQGTEGALDNKSYFLCLSFVASSTYASSSSVLCLAAFSSRAAPCSAMPQSSVWSVARPVAKHPNLQAISRHICVQSNHCHAD